MSTQILAQLRIPQILCQFHQLPLFFSPVPSLNTYLSFTIMCRIIILPKLDILYTELCDFDILAFSESWLNASVPDEDLYFQLNHKQRKDRDGDSHGGVILYVKKYLHYIRRRAMEPNGIECI